MSEPSSHERSIQEMEDAIIEDVKTWPLYLINPKARKFIEKVRREDAKRVASPAHEDGDLGAYPGHANAAPCLPAQEEEREGEDLDALRDILGEAVGFCGCHDHGMMEDLVAVMDLLQPEQNLHINNICHRTGHTYRYVHLILNVLDAAGLTEHGSSVRGSWLTEKGAALLDLVRPLLGAPVEDRGVHC